jgi:hypothetical protein
MREGLFMGKQPITREYFIKRLTDLCLRSGLSGFPTDVTAQHILLKSAVITFGNGNGFTEQAVNEKLKLWIQEIVHLKSMDHSTLRRMLVDAGYFTRNKDGSSYQVVSAAPQPGFFEDSVDQIDIAAVLQNAREEIARRKKEYLEKQAK